MLKKQLTLSADKRFLSLPPHSASCPSAFEEKHFHKLSHGPANHLSGSPREGDEEEQDRQTGDKLDGDSGQEFQGLDQEGSPGLGDSLFVHFLPIEACVLVQLPPTLPEKPLHPDEGFKRLHFAPKHLRKMVN